MRHFSVQLYSVRDAFLASPVAALSRLAELGFTHVEPYRFVDDVEAVTELLGSLGLQAPSAHTRFIGEDQDRIFAAALRLGAATLVQPVSDKALWSEAEGIAHLASQLNEASARAAELGLTVGYHNHAFEYAGGVSAPLERLADQLSEEVVLEIDTYWVAVAGDDPVRLLETLGDRVGLLHVKDGPITAEPLDQVAAGQGAMPVPEILAAAPDALAVLELDDHRGDVFDALRDGLCYVRGIE